MLRIKLATVLVGLAGVLVVSPLATARTNATTATTVGVKAMDFKFVLSRKSAPHGTVVFKVTNRGRVNHDFKIAGKKTPILKPGKSATLKVRLKRGKFTYICTVDSHARLGMKGVFRST